MKKTKKLKFFQKVVKAKLPTLQMDNSEIAIFVTIGLIALSLIVGLVVFLTRRPKDKKVYLVGLSGSGKTTLFYKIVANEKVSSITSQVPNSYMLTEGKKTLEFIDLPGHPRIRTEVMNKIKESTAIIFTIDSETILKNISDIANFLYDILSDSIIIQKKVPILIAITKTDIVGSRDIDFIQQELEKEIEFVRSNRLKSNYVVDGETEQLYLGEEGKEFTFNQLINPVSFVSTSVNHNDVSQVTDFLRKILLK